VIRNFYSIVNLAQFGWWERAMRNRDLWMASTVIGFSVAAASPAFAATLTGSQLSSPPVGLTDKGPSTSATDSGGTITLTSPDNVGGGGLSQFDDTAVATFSSGIDGTNSLGTLSNVVSEGAAGDISFDLATSSNGGNGQFAYWNVELVNPNDTAETAIINAFGDNKTGANPFNQGTAGNSSVDASGGYDQAGTALGFGFGSTWATVDAYSYDGTDLGSWDVAALTISVGGWDTGKTTTDTIDSLTLPGTATPLPSALPLFVGGLGGIGLLGWRSSRKRRNDFALAAA
jgi:hypothetical protein